MHRAQAFVISTAFLAALLAAGCGSSNSPVGPSPEPTKPVAAITGTVVTGMTLGGQASSRPVREPGSYAAMCCAAGGITVTVVGTDLSTITNEYGQFSIGNVPAGTITLQFTGPGINATLVVNGLVVNQTFSLIVEVAGNECRVWNENNTTVEEIRVVGRVESVDGGTLVVSGIQVRTTTDTEYRPLAAAAPGQKCVVVACNVGSPLDLPIGTLVEVLGLVQTDGAILARKITALDLVCTV